MHCTDWFKRRFSNIKRVSIFGTRLAKFRRRLRWKLLQTLHCVLLPHYLRYDPHRILHVQIPFLYFPSLGFSLPLDVRKKTEQRPFNGLEHIFKRIKAYSPWNPSIPSKKTGDLLSALAKEVPPPPPGARPCEACCNRQEIEPRGQKIMFPTEPISKMTRGARPVADSISIAAK